MTRPHVDSLPAPLRVAAQRLGRVLQARGHQAWIVGGAVRDLALGREPKDVDLATDALPDEVESLFPHTNPVGKAFGTILVHLDAALFVEQGLEEPRSMDVELTTFRHDGAYEDGRRPTSVAYGASVAEDARRRDFTCNALYLDPLGDGFEDPEGGLADLDAGRLRCVGDPAARFAEDGLRLLRLVRFEARFGLVPDAQTLAGARAAREALRSVSPERVHAELRGVFGTLRPGAALRRMAELQLEELALPGLTALDAGRPEFLDVRIEALERLGGPLEPELGLALLLDPDPFPGVAPPSSLHGRSVALLDHLRPSRAERRGITQTWAGSQRLAALLGDAGTRRSTRIRLLREPEWPRVYALALAWLGAQPNAEHRERIEALERQRLALGAQALRPEPLLVSADLAAAGVQRGPRWSELLEAAEDLQLDGELDSRDAALAWLAAQA